MTNVSFCRYGEGLRLVPLSDLLEVATTGDLLARVEYSGCEGFYCEVARWDSVWGWCRYAFYKFLGGEPGNAQDDAQAAADAINNAGWHKGRIGLINSMPNFCEPATTTC